MYEWVCIFVARSIKYFSKSNVHCQISRDGHIFNKSMICDICLSIWEWIDLIKFMGVFKQMRKEATHSL